MRLGVTWETNRRQSALNDRDYVRTTNLCVTDLWVVNHEHHLLSSSPSSVIQSGTRGGYIVGPQDRLAITVYKSRR